MFSSCVQAQDAAADPSRRIRSTAKPVSFKVEFKERSMVWILTVKGAFGLLVVFSVPSNGGEANSNVFPSNVATLRRPDRLKFIGAGDDGR